MMEKKNIFAIVGSASRNSGNLKLVEIFAGIVKDDFDVAVCNYLKSLPHFDPDLSIDNHPVQIIELINKIEKADGVLICTPEYVFSIPSGLKNAIEWCVSTTVFYDKPVGIITASASGKKGHEELQLIMKTLTAKFTDDTTLLIQGIKGKIDPQGTIADQKIINDLLNFASAFKSLVNNN